MPGAPHPHPLPTRGRGGAGRQAMAMEGRVPPSPLVGEGWGGGASPRSKEAMRRIMALSPEGGDGDAVGLVHSDLGIGQVAGGVFRPGIAGDL